MAIQVAFIVTAVLLTMAAVFPHDSGARAEEDLECDEARTVTLNSVDYNLRLCTNDNSKCQCVDGLPENECGATISHCKTVMWNQGSLNSSICSVLFSSGQCYVPASQNDSGIVPNCKDVSTEVDACAEEMSTEEMSTEDMSTEDMSTEEMSTEKMSTEGNNEVQVSTEGVSTEGSSGLYICSTIVALLAILTAAVNL